MVRVIYIKDPGNIIRERRNRADKLEQIAKEINSRHKISLHPNLRSNTYIDTIEEVTKLIVSNSTGTISIDFQNRTIDVRDQNTMTLATEIAEEYKRIAKEDYTIRLISNKTSYTKKQKFNF